jgi:hypothetical protein
MRHPLMLSSCTVSLHQRLPTFYNFVSVKMRPVAPPKESKPAYHFPASSLQLVPFHSWRKSKNDASNPSVLPRSQRNGRKYVLPTAVDHFFLCTIATHIVDPKRSWRSGSSGLFNEGNSIQTIRTPASYKKETD